MRSNEEQRLESLYRPTLPKVARFIQQQGGDLHTAKDLFHDAIIIYLEKLNNSALQIHISTEAYIIGISRILWLKKHKQQLNHKPLDGMEDYISIPEDFYTPPPVPGNILSYLKAAGQKCLQLLQAFYYDHLSMEEIAGNFSYKTTHSATVQKYKCLEKIRDHIKKMDVYAETVG